MKDPADRKRSLLKCLLHATADAPHRACEAGRNYAIGAGLGSSKKGEMEEFLDMTLNEVIEALLEPPP